MLSAQTLKCKPVCVWGNLRGPVGFVSVEPLAGGLSEREPGAGAGAEGRIKNNIVCSNP